ncbi:MAG: hypothetical protein O4806_08070, partial [Trichodesmium sp. St5_bin8]|nr:hypothetical protein [Trichodesmium sp. St5_bin8]
PYLMILVDWHLGQCIAIKLNFNLYFTITMQDYLKLLWRSLLFTTSNILSVSQPWQKLLEMLLF